MPATGSPLLNAVPTGSCQADGASGITTDQRGITRPQGTGCDIGAVEVEVAAPPTTSTTSTTVPSNAAAAVEATPAFTG
ncbi:MAG: choice-of-anchor Q domain-containing protein [Acidimicrobiales bacterium]